MNYGRFQLHNCVGGVAWVAIFIFGGYLFGNIPLVKNNFGVVTLLIVAVSLVPIALAIVRGKTGGVKPALIFDSFLGRAPRWYKLTIIVLLALNPVVLQHRRRISDGLAGAGGVHLRPGDDAQVLSPAAGAAGARSGADAHDRRRTGLRGSRAWIPSDPAADIHAGRRLLPQDLLLAAFTRLSLAIRSKALLAFTFCLVAAVLSAFLDALTVVAVVVTVGAGFYAVYHRVASGRGDEEQYELADDSRIATAQRGDLEAFRAYLRSLMMHAAVGTKRSAACVPWSVNRRTCWWACVPAGTSPSSSSTWHRSRCRCSRLDWH